MSELFTTTWHGREADQAAAQGRYFNREMAMRRPLPPCDEPDTIAQQQSQLWNKQSNFTALGAILAACERDMQRVAANTYSFGGRSERMCQEVQEYARKCAAVLASIKKPAFDEAEQYDLKAKGLSSVQD